MTRRLWPLTFVFLLAAPTHSAFAQLQSDQIAILVNTNHPDSKPIADYYCLKRSVPTSHIIALPMDTSEIISRRVYDESIAPVIRDRLNHLDLKDKIKCLLTVRGVPLRIGPVLLDKNALKHRNLIASRLKQEVGRLKQLTVDLNNLTRRIKSQPPAPSVDLNNFSLPRPPPPPRCPRPNPPARCPRRPDSDSKNNRRPKPQNPQSPAKHPHPPIRTTH